MDPVSASTIIGAIITASTEAATVAFDSIDTNSDIALVIDNKSSKDFQIKNYKPTHGHWKESIDKSILAGYTQEYNQIIDSINKQYGPNPTPEQVNEVLDKWKGKLEQDEKLSVVTVSGVGDGNGFEAVLHLMSTSTNHIEIGIVFRKRPGGHYGIGVTFLDGVVWGENEDKARDEIMDRIKHADKHPNTQYSDGGSSILLRDQSGLQISVGSPGEKNTVEISSPQEN